MNYFGEKLIVRIYHRSGYSKYAYEFLLFALTNGIFNRMFFPDLKFYATYIWPVNMLILGVACGLLFIKTNGWLNKTKNTLLIFVIGVPFISEYIFTFRGLTLAVMFCYISFYLVILIEVIRQITKKSDINLSVVLGSVSGYLIIIVISTFSFVLANYLLPNSFAGISTENISERFSEFQYFSLITVSSIGYGDITPIHPTTRLLAAFWGVTGQFYTIGLVGVLISKFSWK